MVGTECGTRILGNASFFCANHSKYHAGVGMHKPEGLVRYLECTTLLHAASPAG